MADSLLYLRPSRLMLARLPGSRETRVKVLQVLDGICRAGSTPSPTPRLTYGLWEVQQLVVLQVQVGDLRAVADLLGQVFQLVVGHVQGDQVAQLPYTSTHTVSIQGLHPLSAQFQGVDVVTLSDVKAH